MKNKIKLFFSLGLFCLICTFLNNAYAATGNSTWDDDAMTTVGSLISTEMDTKMNDVDPGTNGGVSGTLSSITDKTISYIDLAIYLVLAFGIIFIIYNGFLLVFSPVKDGIAQKVKTRMIYIGFGTIVVTGVFYIVKVVLAVVNTVQ